MNEPKMRRWLRFWPGKPQAALPNELHPPGQFQSLLERERALSDRSEQGFSLLVFHIQGWNGGGRLRMLVEALQEHTRLSDEIGWHGDEIGVILPQTAPGGARTLADRIVKKLAAIPGGAIQYTLYSYPIKGSGDASIHGSDSNRPAQPPEWKRQKRKQAAVAAVPLQRLLIADPPWWKRALDALGALAALILTAPIFLAVAAWIKSVSPGPVFFRQQRIGFRNQPFMMWKFRTMHLDADDGIHRRHLSALMQDDETLTKLDAEDDPRIIPGGRLLRSSALDELPQIFNVLRGQMSLVGPRPCMPYEADKYKQWHHRRFDTLPGMTGLWQVKGKNSTTFSQMMRLDIAYLRARSLWTDLWIVLCTLPAIWKQRGNGASSGDDSKTPRGGMRLAYRKRSAKRSSAESHEIEVPSS